jgi:hypothetical protein
MRQAQVERVNRQCHHSYVFYCAVVLCIAGCATPQAAQTGDKPPNQVQLDSAVHDALKGGFHAKLSKGDTLYCREQSHIGTHVSTLDCYTPEQLAKLETLRSSIHAMLNQPMVCDGGFWCNGS